MAKQKKAGKTGSVREPQLNISSIPRPLFDWLETRLADLRISKNEAGRIALYLYLSLPDEVRKAVNRSFDRFSEEDLDQPLDKVPDTTEEIADLIAREAAAYVGKGKARNRKK